jgi:putative ABC transport system permease protein
MDNKLIIANLLHRPIRTLVSLLAVAIEVAMVVLVVGLCHGLVNESAKRVEGVGGDILVQPPTSSFLIGMTSAPMPIRIGERLNGLPRVLAVAPALFVPNASTRFLGYIWGIDMGSFDSVSGGFAFHTGHALESPYDILVDDVYAKANHIKVDQTLTLLNHDFHVAGIVERGKGARLFIPLATAQDLLGTPDKASMFFVKCTDPAYTDQVAAEIHKLIPACSITPIKQYMTLMTSNNLPFLNAFITTMIGIAVAIGFLVIFLSMYTTVTERTREIGILKSLGASKRYIIAIILRESTLLAAVGILVGLGGSLILRKLVLGFFPTLSVDLTWDWRLYAACLAVIGNLLGAFYPALRASRVDPIVALRWE